MTNSDIVGYWRGISVSPILKLTTMVLFLAVRDKAESVTFKQRRGKSPKMTYTPKGHGECDMIPPPRHLFLSMMKILRRLGREAAKNPTSALSFSYVETSDERNFVLSIKYEEEGDVMAEIESLFKNFHKKEEAQEKLEMKSMRWKRLKRRLTALVIVILSLFAVLALIYLLSS